MALMPDPRCGFENQADVDEPMYYAKPLVGPFSSYFAGDKGYMPSVNNRPKWEAKRDCGDIPVQADLTCDGSSFTDDAAASCAGWTGITQDECQAHCDDSVQATNCPQKDCAFAVFTTASGQCHLYETDECETPTASVGNVLLTSGPPPLELSLSNCYAASYAAGPGPAIGDSGGHTVGGGGSGSVTISAQTGTPVVVILGPMSYRSADVGMPEVSSSAADSIEYKISEPVDCGGGASHVNENVFGYFAEPPGVYATDENVNYEVGVIDVIETPDTWTPVTFQGKIKNAVVFITPQSGRTDGEWLVVRIQNVNEYGFEYMHRRALQSSTDPRTKQDQVGWLAVPGGIGSIRGHRYMAGVTESVLDTGSPYVVTDGTQMKCESFYFDTKN